MRISTQNVAGMRREFSRAQGPKIALLRKLIGWNTDFLILTEVKANVNHVLKTKLHRRLTPSMHSLHENARRGVIIFSDKKHKIIEGSQREATMQGHIAAAVYEINHTRTIVAGFYGEPASNDRSSAEILRELQQILEELQHIYHTRTIILAGDFNVTIHQRDSNNPNHTAKPQSANILHTLIEDFQLTDIALLTKKPFHTWQRPGIQGHSSRLDLILTNIPIQNPQFALTHTFLDHAYLDANFNEIKPQKAPAMKDFILGSDEYLIRAQDLIEGHINQLGVVGGDGSDEGTEDDIQELSCVTIDQGKTFEKIHEGQTALHVFNSLLSRLHDLHGEIAREKNRQTANKLKLPSLQLADLKKRLKKSKSENEKRELHDQITEIQKTIKDDIEAKDQASRMRISNFYKTVNGKMLPESFFCIKEPKSNRSITRLEHEGRDVTDPEEIVDIMQKWYETTAEQVPEQLMTLSDFLTHNDLQLPQLSTEDCEELEQDFSIDEVKQALAEAKIVSAPGPSGQTISFFKLIFMHVPILMTQALNQLVFVPKLISDDGFKWIQERKVIYIPKKPSPQTPGDYRPLSMLEVLYKIPSRILARRLTRILPKLIGPHQHGFMPQKGIQEPSLLATHMIEEANKYGKPLQLVSFDIEKAFDKVGHKVIVQALRAFGIPETIVQALRQYTLVGFAKVEVNGRQGIIITIRTGSGQGDPLSSILFLLASEPLNRALIKKHSTLVYTTNEGLHPGPVTYADDGLHGLALPTPQSIKPILQTYEDFKNVSGLKVNLNKTAALCINTSPEIIHGLQQLGISTPDHIKHLGIHLGKTLQATIQHTMEHISPKAVQRRILATTPPTDLLHRALLINTAFLPLYNHVFMAIPIHSKFCDDLFKDVTSFLWTRQKEGQQVQKRVLVAKARVAAPPSMGGLKISHPRDVVTGLQQNLIQRILNKTQRNIPSLLPQLLQGLLEKINRPSLEEHIDRLGPSQWLCTGDKLEQENTMLGQSFKSMATLLENHETSNESWHCAAIVGHTLSMEHLLLRFTNEESNTLRDKDIVTVSQLFQENEETGQLSRIVNHELMEEIAATHPWLELKLRTLATEINKKKFPILDKYICHITSGTLLVRGEKHLSQIHKKIISEQLAAKIGTAPAYQTRIRDNVYVPDRATFHAAFKVLDLPWIPSKTKQTAFEILNRTIWTNNKGFKSKKIDDPSCNRCEETETMEHLLHGCEHYSAPLWAEFSAALTSCTQNHVGHDIPQIALTPREIIFNAMHPTLAHHITDVHTKSVITLTIQEIKRNIIYKRMNLQQSENDLIVPIIRIQAHLLSVLRKTLSFLIYQGTSKTNSSRIFLNVLIQKLTDRIA